MEQRIKDIEIIYDEFQLNQKPINITKSQVMIAMKDSYKFQKIMNDKLMELQNEKRKTRKI